MQESHQICLIHCINTKMPGPLKMFEHSATNYDTQLNYNNNKKVQYS